MDRIGKVYFKEAYAGELKPEGEGFCFTYDPDYLANGTPLGFNLPLRHPPFYCETLFPFFENLVSEGWLRTLQARSQKIDFNDSFGLLLANGRDLPGAVCILKEDDALL